VHVLVKYVYIYLDPAFSYFFLLLTMVFMTYFMPQCCADTMLQ